MNTVSIVLARGGSKGIPGKNIMNFCGRPLIAWTIRHCIEAGVEQTFVSSDSPEILRVGEEHGAIPIRRPAEIAGDSATSEAGWLHAIDEIESSGTRVDWIVAPQVTSPLRTSEDIQAGLSLASQGDYDSLFSCSVAEDLLMWTGGAQGLKALNYDIRNRRRRQDFGKQYIENGSFYLFTPETLRIHGNRFGHRVGMVEMEFWKMFEIDAVEDVRMCSALMREFLLS